MDPIWTKNPEAYLSIKNESRKLVLYPRLLEIIKQYGPKSVLDYGCGDGAFAMLIDKGKEIGLYDISAKVLDIAKKNLSERNVTIYHKMQQIPKDHYDCIVLSMVLMTIGEYSTLKDVLKNAAKVKRSDGKMIVAVTHPCFRQYYFSTFYTEYAKAKEFKYFAEGHRFTVHIKDLKSNEQVSFKDYHWSLSLTMNALIEVGLRIVQVQELRDTVKSELTCNKNLPAYLIIVCQ